MTEQPRSQEAVLPCRHCQARIEPGPTGGWVDAEGFTRCQKNLPHEPLRGAEQPRSQEAALDGLADTSRIEVAINRLADAAKLPRPYHRPCARYWGSDGTLCSTHNGRFASHVDTTCDRAAEQPRSQEAALDVDLMREHAEEAIEYGYKRVEVDPAALLRVLDRAALAATPPEEGE